MSVQVILREPIDNLGSRGDVVKVANGYARNYLLPRKLALPVTESNQRRVSRERVVADAQDAAEKEAAEAFASRLSQAVLYHWSTGRADEHDVRLRDQWRCRGKPGGAIV